MKKMTRKILLSITLLIGCMNFIYSADERSLQHEQLKQNFKLAIFMALPPDPQYEVLTWLKPDRRAFSNSLEEISLDEMSMNSSKEALIGEFFYNHAQSYNQILKNRNGNTHFAIKQIPSQLSTVQIDSARLRMIIMDKDSRMKNLAFINIAVDLNRHSLIDFIVDISMDVDQNRPLDQAFKLHRYNTAVQLMYAGAHLNEISNPLHCLASDNNADSIDSQNQVAEFLIRGGIDINKIDKDQHKTALHYAAYNSNIELIQLLIEYGARVDIEDAFGCTAFDCVCDSDCECDAAREILHQATSRKKMKKIEDDLA